MSQLKHLCDEEGDTQLIDTEALAVAEDKFLLIAQGLNRMNKKLNHKFAAVDSIFNRGTDGIEQRLQEACNEIDDHTKKLAGIMQENRKMRQDMNILKGIEQKQSADLDHLKDKLNSVIARGMNNNITFGNLKEIPGENCKEVVSDFLQTTLNIQLYDDEIEVAHRMGKSMTNGPRQMVAHCKSSLVK